MCVCRSPSRLIPFSEPSGDLHTHIYVIDKIGFFLGLTWCPSFSSCWEVHQGPPQVSSPNHRDLLVLQNHLHLHDEVRGGRCRGSRHLHHVRTCLRDLRPFLL